MIQFGVVKEPEKGGEEKEDSNDSNRVPNSNRGHLEHLKAQTL